MNNKTAAIILVKTGISNSFSNIVDGSGSYYYLDMAYDEDKVLVDYHNNPDQMWALADWFDVVSCRRSAYLREWDRLRTKHGTTRTEAMLKCIDKCLEDYKD